MKISVLVPKRQHYSPTKDLELSQTLASLTRFPAAQMQWKVTYHLVPCPTLVEYAAVHSTESVATVITQLLYKQVAVIVIVFTHDRVKF